MKFRGIATGLTLLTFGLTGAGCGGGSVVDSPTPVPTPQPSPSLPAVMAAGDISCDSSTPQLPCKAKDTSDLILRERAQRSKVLVLPLGDLQYEAGTLTQFRTNYEVSWGRLNEISRPVAGNHEYETRGAAGYFDYFGGAGILVGERGAGWYAYNLGSWHFVALNSNCDFVGGCQAGSPQYRWLQTDLLNSRQPCTIAYLHHPFISTGQNGNTPALLPLIRLLYENRAEMVLTGHDHDYERFVPMTPELVPFPAGGLRFFVVGTGGRDLRAFGRPALPITAFRTNEHFGALRIELSESSYEWAFMNTAGTVLDRGSAACF